MNMRDIWDKKAKSLFSEIENNYEKTKTIDARKVEKYLILKDQVLKFSR